MQKSMNFKIIQEKLSFDIINILKNKEVADKLIFKLKKIDYIEYLNELVIIAEQNNLHVKLFRYDLNNLQFEYSEKDLKKSIFIFQKSIILN